MSAIALQGIALIIRSCLMFKTHESAYYNLAPVYGPDHHHWRLVEREISSPWLHATVKVTEGGIEYTKTVMPNDLTTFLEMANLKTPDARIGELQLMSPAWMNGAGRWLLEPIRQIDIARSVDNELIHIYVTHEGKNYYDPSRTPAEIQELTNQRTVYYTNLS